MSSLARENYLSELRRIDWDFTGENGAGGFAGYHWYPARYVPQLAGILINYFSEPAQTVVDPFCGSGTTLTEAFKFGRKAVGVDLNPIGVLMTRAKLVPYDKATFKEYADAVLDNARTCLTEIHGLLLHPLHLETLVPRYDENSSWYHPTTLAELASIWTALQRHASSQYHDVGATAFSAILRHCCSQGNHWGWICDNVKPRTYVYRDAIKAFTKKLDDYCVCARELLEEAAELQDERLPVTELQVYQGDCADVLSRFPDGTFDLVVTSPPYYNMTDYIKSQRLSLLWFGYDLGEIRNREIGARYKRGRTDSLGQYVQRMRESFGEIARVLHCGRMCCIIVGESPKYTPFLGQLRRVFDDVGLELQTSLGRRVRKQRSLSPSLCDENILIMRKV